ncbi:glycoside hydrolase [Pavlovales sp. CCMP2436]|nr:glycoside hydrolase [Pavlovales sp. CCMP2436]
MVGGHGCDFAAGYVFVGGRCQRAQEVGAPPELLDIPGFKFGVATSAFQVEGGTREGGRGASIWDTFQALPGRVENGEDADVACDHFHRWEEDVALLAELGVDYYRMSIAWPRVMPDGYKLNAEGLAFYHRLFDRLQLLGIEPMVTLYHWDLPQVLEDLGGWRNKTLIVPAFANYAKEMFIEFGAKVKRWSTFNEPATFVFIGTDLGIHAPGRCSHRERCPEGDSLREPLLITHSVLVAHARAVEQLRKLDTKGGTCEGCLVGMYTAPMNESLSADWQAAQWRMESELGIWTDPLYFGDYPASVVEAAGDRLPSFSLEEKRLLKGSTDYFGLNL